MVILRSMILFATTIVLLFCLIRTTGGQVVSPIWKTDVGGNVGSLFSSGEIAIVGTHSKDYLNGRLVCVDATTGEKIWENKFPRLKEHFLDAPSAPIRCIPAITDNKVVVYNNRAEIVCLKLNGRRRDGIGKRKGGTKTAKILWKKDLRAEFNVFKRDQIGFGAPVPSPLVQSGRVICASGNGSTIEIEDYVGEEKTTVPSPAAPSCVCLDLADGKLKWSTNSGSKNVIFSSVATPIQLNNATGFFVRGDGAAVLISLDDGKEIKKLDDGVFYWSWATPIKVGTKLIISNSLPWSIPSNREVSGKKCCIVCYEIDQLLDLQNRPKPSWIFSGAQYAGTRSKPVVKNGILHVFSRESNLVAIDISDGRELWNDKIDISDREFSGLQFWSNLLLAPTPNGVKFYNIGQSKKIVHELELGMEPQAISVSENNLLIGGHGFVYSFGSIRELLELEN